MFACSDYIDYIMLRLQHEHPCLHLAAPCIAHCDDVGKRGGSGAPEVLTNSEKRTLVEKNSQN